MLLKNEVARLQDKREMEQLLSALHESFLIASVIGMDAANVHKSIIINRGSRHGLKHNMAVVDRYGNLVGRIVNPVSYGEATVQLITDDNSSVAVQSETNRVIGQLSGDSKGKTCWLRYVLATNDGLIEGEELITSGFDKIFPAGIRVGKVLSITTDSSLFKKIEVKPHLDFRKLNQVAVLTRRTDELDFDEEK
jgi:rod shape-determining protein MreC